MPGCHWTAPWETMQDGRQEKQLSCFSEQEAVLTDVILRDLMMAPYSPCQHKWNNTIVRYAPITSITLDIDENSLGFLFVLFHQK